MTAVLATPPFLAFFDADGNPLAGGKIYTYAAGTSFMVPKATYTDESGDTEMPNPITLDDAGRATWWLIGSYGYVIKDALGNTIETTDNVTSFTTLAAANDAYFQSFSGDGSTMSFTTSQNLGVDEKGLLIFVNKALQSCVTNGTFASDTGWTKGAGWTIAAGVATATGAISTAISQTSPVTLVQGQAYSLTYTITRSAGGLIPSIGGTAGTERTASGTYNEVIVCGSSQTTAFTGNAFTGTLDNVVINVAATAGFDVISPTAYTINGTTLTFATAPAVGTNNIYVFAPSLLLGAASAAADLAQSYAALALNSQNSAAASAASAAAFAQAKIGWTFSSTTSMADPGSGLVRFNNASLASVTAIAISDLSADTGNPDLSAWINTWDDGSGSNRGTLYIFKDDANFALYTIAGANTDNTTWNQLAVTYLASSGSFSNTDTLYLGFAANGATTVTGGITALTGDVQASGTGSVAATIGTNAVTNAKAAQMATLTVKSNITGGLANAADNSLTAILDAAVGNAQGSILFRGASAWEDLAPGTLGQALLSGGNAADVAWGSIGSATATTTSLTGTSVVLPVDFTTYSVYKFILNNPSISGANIGITIEGSSDGGAIYGTSTYQITRLVGATPTSQTAYVAYRSNTGAAWGQIEVCQPATGGAATVTANSAGVADNVSTNGGGSLGVSAAINRIRIADSAGGTFNGGSITFYPVARR